MSRRVIRGCGLITLLLMLATGCAGGGGQFGQDLSQNKGLAIGGLGGMTAGGLIAAAAHASPAGIAAGVILGVTVEQGLLRFMRGRDATILLLVTYALFLILEDAIKLIWGVDPYLVSEPYGML